MHILFMLTFSLLCILPTKPTYFSKYRLNRTFISSKNPHITNAATHSDNNTARVGARTLSLKYLKCGPQSWAKETYFVVT